MRKENNVIKNGTRFGKLVVSGVSQSKKTGKYSHLYYQCECDCGVKKLVRKDHLRYGIVVSCGCKQREFFKGQGTGERAWNWKGGRRIEDGYVFIYQPQHPRSKSNGYIREHTIVMENKLGRMLLPSENIHHINGIKTDNRVDNLELWSRSQPPGQRVADKVLWAKQILEIYG